MSTTFGVLKIKVDHNKLVDEDGELLEYISDSVFEPIWFKGNNQSGWWLSEIARHLPDETIVYALDNTRQGIYTIGDLRKIP